jgi:hypothetical protein
MRSNFAVFFVTILTIMMDRSRFLSLFDLGRYIGDQQQELPVDVIFSSLI